MRLKKTTIANNRLNRSHPSLKVVGLEFGVLWVLDGVILVPVVYRCVKRDFVGGILVGEYFLNHRPPNPGGG